MLLRTAQLVLLLAMVACSREGHAFEAADTVLVPPSVYFLIL